MRRATIHCGLADWGDPEFLPRLRLFLASARSDCGLTEAGRDNLEATAIRFAEGRLRLECLVRQHPEIRQIKLPRPVIVTGLPRSGTTALVSAIASHHGLQSLRYRDVVQPFAPPQRANFAGRHADAVERAMPALNQLHSMAPEAQADDAELMGLAFAGYGLEWLCHAPKWRDYYLSADQRPAYRYLKLALQALTFIGGGNGRWAIKNPQHMEQLPALKAVFPDALLVVARRDPNAQLRSMDRVMDALVPLLRTRAIPKAYWADRFAVMQHRYEAERCLFPDRIELPLGWSADETAPVVWAATNLQEPVAAP